MQRSNLPLRKSAAALLVTLLATTPLFGWGHQGHQYINRVAAQTLPSDMPAFLRTTDAIDEIEYLGPEPDLWRSKGTPELSAEQAPEHDINLEVADLIGTLPRKRYDYIRALQAYADTHPAMAADLTPERVGLLPYQADEVYQRLEVAFRAYRDLSAAKRNTKPVEAAIIFYAGWLGHYAGDGSQPLHVTVQYNGWVGPNPNGYTTAKTIHSQFESTFVGANVKPEDFAPLVGKPHVMQDVFTDYVAYLNHSLTLTEKVYQLEKAGGFNGAGSAESIAFTRERLAAGATMLRDLIYTAWVKSADLPTDPYLM